MSNLPLIIGIGVAEAAIGGLITLLVYCLPRGLRMTKAWPILYGLLIVLACIALIMGSIAVVYWTTPRYNTTQYLCKHIVTPTPGGGHYTLVGAVPVWRENTTPVCLDNR